MITVEIRGVDYQGIVIGELNINMAHASSSFNLTASAKPNSSYPFRANDSVRIKVDGIVRLTGYIDAVIPRYNDTQHSITIIGRDQTADFIDSSLPDGIQFEGPISLKVMFETILRQMGLSHIGVIDTTTIKDFSEDEFLSSSVGMNAFEFIESYARKRQSLIGTDGSGNFVIQKGSKVSLKSQLINRIGNPDGQNNIKSGSGNYDLSSRYNKYIFHSQKNPSAKAFSFAETTITEPISSVEIDDSIRSGRTLIQYLEQAGDADDCTERAKWEANYRRIKSQQPIILISGNSGVDGEMYQVNKQIYILDEFLDLDAKMLITGLKFINAVSSPEGGVGSTTTFTLAPSDAYTVQTRETQQKKAKTKTGNKFLNLVGG